MAGPDPILGEQIADAALTSNSSIDISGYSNPRTFAEAEVFVDDMLGANKFTRFDTATGNSVRRPAGLKAIINQVGNVIDEFERSGKLASFLLSQAALHLLNPAVSAPWGAQRQIINPITLITGPPFLFGGLTTDSISPIVAPQNPVTDAKEDKLRSLYSGNDIEIRPEAGIPPVNIDGPNTRFPSDDGALGGLFEGVGGVTIDQKIQELNLMDKGQVGQPPKDTFESTTLFEGSGQNVNLTTDPGDSGRAEFVGDEILRPNLSALFEKRAVGPNFGGGPRGFGYSFVRKEAIVDLTPLARRQRSAQKNIDTFMNAESRIFEQNNGYLDSTISDTAVVVPFYFQDLRRPERFLYFKAFLTSLSETIYPEWEKDRFYGRVDPVGTYKNTTRTFNVSFFLVAMSQEGLTTMWRKLNTFCKMLYPTFNNEGILSKAPVVRLRIGDVVAQQATNVNAVAGFGLPGWIENAEFDYSDAPWEITAYNGPSESELGIVPHWARISFMFQVIHEQNPALDVNHNFPTHIFRRMGSLSREVADNATANDSQNTPTTEPLRNGWNPPPSSDPPDDIGTI